jgi:hypothetical protein
MKYDIIITLLEPDEKTKYFSLKLFSVYVPEDEIENVHDAVWCEIHHCEADWNFDWS